MQKFLSINNKLFKKRTIELDEKYIQPMSEQFNADIDQSLEDSQNDRVISIEDLKAEVKKWS